MTSTNLLLLIAVPSSVGRESTTEVSFSLQKGQSIAFYFYFILYIGKEVQRSIISFLTSSSIFELSSGFWDKPLMTLVISSPISVNSFIPKPLVVHAGVPSLIPEVIHGL